MVATEVLAEGWPRQCEWNDEGWGTGVVGDGSSVERTKSASGESSKGELVESEGESFLILFPGLELPTFQQATSSNYLSIVVS